MFNEQEIEEITDLINSIKNRCEIYIIVSQMQGREYLLPTILEDLYVDAQEIVDEYCSAGI